MPLFYKFSEEQKQQANDASISDFLAGRGEKLTTKGKEMIWNDGTYDINLFGNLWFNHYLGKGGNTIDFVKNYYNVNYNEAVMMILGLNYYDYVGSGSVDKEVKLPEKNESSDRITQYLTVARCIPKILICYFIAKGLIYETTKYHNVVFIGLDNEGIPRHAAIRGTGKQNVYKRVAENSISEYSFHWDGSGNRLYVFESPIDMLSYIALHYEGWKRNSYLACCGVGEKSIARMLNDNKNITEVYLCFDNDEAGKEATKRISEHLYTCKGIITESLVPEHKDWNEDLVEYSNLIE